MADVLADASPTLLPDEVLRVEHLSKVFHVGRGPRRGDEEPHEDDTMDDTDSTLEIVEVDDADEVDEEPIERPPGDVLALDEISLSIRAGTMVGVLGASGAGKSVLLRILGRTCPPSAGRVIVRGLVAPPIGSLTASLEGDMDGNVNLATLADMVGLSRAWAAENADAIFAFAGLEEHRPLHVKRWAKGFSARYLMSAMIHAQPSLMLAEGPPTFGDEPWRTRLEDRIAAERERGMALLVTASDSRVLRRGCDVGVWLDHGRVAMVGPAEAVADAYDDAQSEAGADALGGSQGEMRRRRDELAALRHELVEARTSRARNRAAKLARRRGGPADDEGERPAGPAPRLNVGRVLVRDEAGPLDDRPVEGRRLELRVLATVPIESTLRATVTLEHDGGRHAVGEPVEHQVTDDARVVCRCLLRTATLPVGESEMTIRLELLRDGERLDDESVSMSVTMADGADAPDAAALGAATVELSAARNRR
jgi:ABC-type polysaccharide/polyol phosphate transport system ATPase subunit